MILVLSVSIFQTKKFIFNLLFNLYVIVYRYDTLQLHYYYDNTVYIEVNNFTKLT